MNGRMISDFSLTLTLAVVRYSINALIKAVYTTPDAPDTLDLTIEKPKP
jgi:hypothetical protein